MRSEGEEGEGGEGREGREGREGDDGGNDLTSPRGEEQASQPQHLAGPSQGTIAAWLLDVRAGV